MTDTQQASEFDQLPQIPANASRYEILGVPRDASAEDIRVAYRRLALLYHPDRHPEADRERAGEAFQRIASAYGTLSNPRERRRYDTALDRGDPFHEVVGDKPPVTLADILACFDAYEHIFSSDNLFQMDPTLRDIVSPRLLTEVHEQIVAVWKMPAAPAGVTHPGTYKAGAVVLTNVRVLLPFTYSWEETRGNTKSRFKGAGMPVFVLPLIKGITIISDKRVRNTIWVEVEGEQASTRFRPGRCNLGKLLLIARLWGIAVQARHEDRKRAEWKWALLRPWVWGASVAAGVMGVAAACGIFRGGIVDNPSDLAAFASRNGLWQWYMVAWAAVSAQRVWRYVTAYEAAPLAPAERAGPQTGPGLALEQTAAAPQG